jgi:dihydroorotase
MTYASGIKMDKLIASISSNPRDILGIEKPEIKADAKANLTLFDPTIEWTYNDKSNYSLSKNSPFWNQSMKGKVIGVINGKKSHINKF